MAIYKLDNTVKKYSWGSPDFIPALLGFENSSGEHYAELWMGTHPSAPSILPALSTDLLKFSAEHHDEVFGKGSTQESLSFLLKVLSAGSPLSIQAHPDTSQAAEGFARENRLGIPLDALNRNYKDANHKPEILCALSPFWAMRGFRSATDILKDMERCKSRPANTLKHLLEFDGLQGFFMSLMTMSDTDSAVLIDEILSAAEELDDPRWEWILRLQKAYPGDIGILSPLYLHVLKLNPGEALFVPAGELHCYLSGAGIELMASSDNVLRGGLTPKHIDIPELLKILKFDAAHPGIIRPEEPEPGIFVYDTPAQEFQLSRLQRPSDSLPMTVSNARPSIIINTGPQVTIEDENSSVSLKKGESVFIGAETKHFIISASTGDEISLFRGTGPR